MERGDIMMMITWGVTSFIMITLSVIRIIKTKDKEEVNEAWMWILIAFTPGAVLIGTLVFVIGLVLLITEGPSYLIWKFKTKLNGSKSSN